MLKALLLYLVMLMFSTTVETHLPELEIITSDNISQLELLQRQIFTLNQELITGDLVWIDDDQLAIHSTGFPVFVWSIHQETIRSICQDDQSAHQIVIAIPQVSLACMYLNGLLQVVDIQSGDNLVEHTFDVGQFGSSVSISFNNDGNLFAINYRQPDILTADAWVTQLWNGDLTEQLVSISPSFPNGLVFRPNTLQIILLGEGIEIWEYAPEVQTMEMVSEIDTLYAFDVHFNNDGVLMAISGISHDPEEESRTFIYILEPEIERIVPFTYASNAIDFSQGNDMVVEGGNSSIIFYDIQDITSVQGLYAINLFNFFERNDAGYLLDAKVLDIAFRIDGRILATLHNNGEVLLWGIPCENMVTKCNR